MLLPADAFLGFGASSSLGGSASVNRSGFLVDISTDTRGPWRLGAVASASSLSILGDSRDLETFSCDLDPLALRLPELLLDFAWVRGSVSTGST